MVPWLVSSWARVRSCSASEAAELGDRGGQILARDL
jgi:hypothetical protein